MEWLNTESWILLAKFKREKKKSVLKPEGVGNGLKVIGFDLSIAGSRLA